MKADDYFRRAGHEALWLISHALGVGHSAVYARNEFTPDECARIEALISRRENGEPLQYILGTADFCGRDFSVGPGVLIPRNDTAALIDGVRKIFARDDSFTFMDWGTGSGCIAITLLLEFPESCGYMLDISTEALKYARENLERYGLTDRADIITEAVSPELDLLISNPPYIPSGEISGLMREVRDYEPHSALDGGDDGMKYYREVIALALGRLRPGGYLVLEAGDMRQAVELEGLGGEFEFSGSVNDGGNFPRCITIRRHEAT